MLKFASSAELMQAIRTVSVGQQYVCRAIASKILPGYLLGDQRCSVTQQPITVREREVLTRVALGNSNKLIARDLGLSPKTIEKHRSNFMRKLQLRSVAAVTAYAVRHGMTGSGGYGSHEGVLSRPLSRTA